MEPISVCEELAGTPSTQIPDDGGDQQREDHRISGAAADLKDQFDRQQAHHGERHRTRGGHDAEEIEHAGPQHRDLRRQAVRINDGGDGVGGVVEAVDELEAERDQQCNAQQHKRADRKRRRLRGADIAEEAVQRVADAKREQDGEDHRAADVRPRFEVWASGESGDGAMRHFGLALGCSTGPV
jgi:hypothetical protein